MSKVKFFLLALVAFFFAATVSADVVWSSAFDFDGSEITEPVVIPEVNQIGYSMSLLSGSEKDLALIVKPVNSEERVTIYSTNDPDEEGTYFWNYNPDSRFVKNTDYVLTQHIVSQGYDPGEVSFSRTVHILPEPAVFVLLGVAAAFFLRRRAKSLLVVLAFLSLGTLGAKATTISVGKCFQMWPFERKVIINYTVSDLSETEYINFYYTTDNGESSYDLRENGLLTGDVGPISANGNYRVVWTPDTETMASVKGKMKIGVDVYEPEPPTPSTYMIIDVSGGYQAQSYPVSYTDEEPSGGWNINEYKTTKIVLKYCPPVSFTMGSPGDELGRQSDETQRNITLTKGFYVGIFEVTDQQYGEIYDGVWNNIPPYSYYPKKDVSYETIRGSSWPSSTTPGANSFLDKLNSRTGLSFDLPTEAQWEYACRGETTKATNRDENLSATDECDEMDRVANYFGTTGQRAVGSKMPSLSGTYDMHGSVGEYCLDWYGPYDTTDVIDPKGPDTGSYRVVRGGDSEDDARNCRSASRQVPMFCGFRLFMVVD
jgi:hypothetical protein